MELARRAIDDWQRLERDHDVTILHLTGQLDVGPEDKLAALAGAMGAGGAPFHEVDRDALVSSFPEFALRGDERAIFHPQAGTVLADIAMRTLLADAARHGTQVLQPERAVELRATPRGDVTVVTDRRRVEAGQVVVAAGPWTGDLLSQLGLAISLTPAIGQVTFLDAPAMISRPALMDWLVLGGVGVYGHPVPGVGYKVAFDAGAGQPWDADVDVWEPDLDEERRLLGWLQDRMPGVAPRVALSQRHPWTMTADGDFVIDRSGPFVIAGGCSGHAFKFGPTLGSLIADVVDGVPRPELALFALDRPGLQDRVGPSATIRR